MVLFLVVEQHDSFRDFDDFEELPYLTLLVPLTTVNHNIQQRSFIEDWFFHI